MIQIDIPMPKMCPDCPFHHHLICDLHDGIPAHEVSMVTRPEWCPLKEGGK